MMDNKILLEKIEIKRIKNKLRIEPDGRDKKLKKYKLDPLMECSLPDFERFPSDITVETSQDAVKIYPKYAYIASDANKSQRKQINNHEEHKLTSFFEDGDNKYRQLMTEETTFNDASCESGTYGSSLCQTNNISSPSKSCSAFLQSKYPVQDFKYGKLNKEIKKFLKKFDGESEKLLDNSDVSDSCFFNSPVFERHSIQSSDPSIRCGAVNKNAVLFDFVNDETTADVLEDFANSNHAYTEPQKIAFQKQRESLPKCSRENKIEELRKYLELSVDCLLSYLESLHNFISNQNIASEDDLNSEHCVNMPNCKYTDEKHEHLSRQDDNADTQVWKTDASNDNLTYCIKSRRPSEVCYSAESSGNRRNKILKSVSSFRQDDNPDTSLSNIYASNESSTSCVKRRTTSDVRYSEESTYNSHNKTLRLEICSCDCCNGRCLHSPIKNNSNKLEVNKASDKKGTSNELKSRIMSCNVKAPNAFSTKTESVPKSKIKYLQNSVKEELDSTTNESKQIGKRSKFAQSNAAIKQSLNYLPSPTHKPNVADKKDKKSKCNRDLIEDQQMNEISLVEDDELDIHECNDTSNGAVHRIRNSKDKKLKCNRDLIEDQQMNEISLVDDELDIDEYNDKSNGAVQCDLSTLLCLAFIFLALLLLVFVVFIFCFI